jgi:hypothetical protein
MHIFLTSALEGGEWSASRPSALLPGKGPLVPTGQEVGWTAEPVCFDLEKILDPTGTRTPTPGRSARSQSLYRQRYNSVVVRWKSTDVSEELIASIFRVEEWAEQEINVKASRKQSPSIHFVITLWMSHPMKFFYQQFESISCFPREV